MDTKGIPLRRRSKDECDDSVAIDMNKCIICQQTTDEQVSTTERGRKRVSEAAEIRNDIVCKRLKHADGEQFVYHVNNICYKRYTLKKSLDALVKVTVPEHDVPAAQEIPPLPQLVQCRPYVTHQQAVQWTYIRNLVLFVHRSNITAPTINSAFRNTKERNNFCEQQRSFRMRYMSEHATCKMSAVYLAPISTAILHVAMHT